jgi:hypothetical protein
MPVDMKEGEIFIACEPDIMPHAVTAPGGFIGMDNLGGPDLAEETRGQVLDLDIFKK